MNKYLLYKYCSTAPGRRGLIQPQRRCACEGLDGEQVRNTEHENHSQKYQSLFHSLHYPSLPQPQLQPQPHITHHTSHCTSHCTHFIPCNLHRCDDIDLVQLKKRTQNMAKNEETRHTLHGPFLQTIFHTRRRSIADALYQHIENNREGG